MLHRGTLIAHRLRETGGEMAVVHAGGRLRGSLPAGTGARGEARGGLLVDALDLPADLAAAIERRRVHVHVRHAALDRVDHFVEFARVDLL